MSFFAYFFFKEQMVCTYKAPSIVCVGGAVKKDRLHKMKKKE